MLFSLFAVEVILFLWIKSSFDLELHWILFIISLFNLCLAGLSLRLGGHLSRGPYLPETLEGLSRTTKAVLGKS